MKGKMKGSSPQTICWWWVGQTRSSAVWRSTVRGELGIYCELLACVPTPSAVYSESEDHVYSHHEVLLTAFPLALEWMDFDPEQPDKIG